MPQNYLDAREVSCTLRNSLDNLSTLLHEVQQGQVHQQGQVQGDAPGSGQSQTPEHTGWQRSAPQRRMWGY